MEKLDSKKMLAIGIRLADEQNGYLIVLSQTMTDKLYKHVQRHLFTLKHAGVFEVGQIAGNKLEKFDRPSKIEDVHKQGFLIRAMTDIDVITSSLDQLMDAAREIIEYGIDDRGDHKGLGFSNGSRMYGIDYSKQIKALDNLTLITSPDIKLDLRTTYKPKKVLTTDDIVFDPNALRAVEQVRQVLPDEDL